MHNSVQYYNLLAVTIWIYNRKAKLFVDLNNRTKGFGVYEKKCIKPYLLNSCSLNPIVFHV